MERRTGLSSLMALPGLPGATFASCTLASALAAPIISRLRVPFAAFAFAAVVSLVPGVYLFRFCGGLVALAEGGAAVAPGLVGATLGDGAMEGLVLLAMGLGLVLPKMLIERFTRSANGVEG